MVHVKNKKIFKRKKKLKESKSELVCLENGSQAKTQHQQGMEECKGHSFLRAAKAQCGQNKGLGGPGGNGGQRESTA